MTADTYAQPLIRAEYATERYHVVVHDQNDGSILHNHHYANYMDADHAARSFVDISKRRLISITHEILDGPGCVVQYHTLLRVTTLAVDKLAEWLGYDIDVMPKTKTWSVI